ncbi:hypothetical protein HS125_03215 [bacterium]|nr:hypothetical protein [bacterium]
MHRFISWWRALLSTMLALGLCAGGWGQLEGDLSKVEPMLRALAKEALGVAAASPTKAAGPTLAATEGVGPLSAAGLKLPAAPSFVPPALLSSEVRDGRLYLDTFIVLAPGASTDNLAALGVLVGSRSGDVITADVPPDLLDEVNALPEVLRVTGSRYTTPMNDAATLETGVQTVWTNQNNRGENALVGVIDSGIDWQHADFKHESGLSRIQYIWDQTDDAGPNPSGYNYGTMWTKSQIDSTPGSVRERDNDEGAGGHGARDRNRRGRRLGDRRRPAITASSASPQGRHLFCQNQVDRAELGRRLHLALRPRGRPGQADGHQHVAGRALRPPRRLRSRRTVS